MCCSCTKEHISFYLHLIPPFQNFPPYPFTFHISHLCFKSSQDSYQIAATFVFVVVVVCGAVAVWLVGWSLHWFFGLKELEKGQLSI